MRGTEIIFTTGVSGVVVDGITKEPINGAKVAIFETIYDGDIFSNKQTISATKEVETDENGKFEIAVKTTNAKNAKYSWRTGKEGYYPGGGGFEIRAEKKKLFNKSVSIYVPDTAIL